MKIRHGCRPFGPGASALSVGMVGALLAMSVAAAASSTASPPSSQGVFRLGHFPDVPEAALTPALVAAMQGILDTATARGLPGVSATVLVADVGAWSGASGTADGSDPVQVGSQFGLASLTKTVIAAEILRLVEDGRIALADRAADHLPSTFRFDSNGATIRDLLAMESGIPDPRLGATSPEVLSDLSRMWTPEEILASVPPGRSAPGARFVYEDANYMLLGLVIREVTGTDVSEALRAYVLADPRLATMVYQPEERPTGPLALPFRGGAVRAGILEAGEGYLPSRSEASSGNGSGCMASDSGALALWGYLLFGGSMLSEASLRAMTDFGEGPTYDRYGLGVFDQTDLAQGFPVSAIGNGGWDEGGYSAILAVLPSHGIVVSVLTNTAGDPVRLVVPIAQELAALSLAR